MTMRFLAAILTLLFSTCICRGGEPGAAGSVKEIFKNSNFDNLTLSCSIPSGDIKWMKNNQSVLATASHSDLTVSTSEIALTNVDLSASGLYTCLKKPDTLIDSFQVKVLEIDGENGSIEGNSSVAAISCEVTTENVSIASMSWIRSGEDVKEGDRHEIRNEGPSRSLLLIRTPNTDDSGLYTCVVGIKQKYSNETAEVARSFSLSAAANVTEIGKLRSKVEEETATIVCNVTGYPVPVVKWYRQLEDDPELKLVEYDTRVTATPSEKTNVPNAVLIIRELKISTDRGDYTCVAINEHGNASLTTTLKVKDKLAAVWPFLGICAEVLILCSIIFIFEKRRNRRMEEEEEVDAVKQDLMNQSNGVDDKELRQRQNATKA